MKIAIVNNKTGKVYLDLTMDDLKTKWEKEYNRVFEEVECEIATDYDWQYNFDDNEDILALKKRTEKTIENELEYYWNEYVENFTSPKGVIPIWQIIVDREV